MGSSSSPRAHSGRHTDVTQQPIRPLELRRCAACVAWPEPCWRCWKERAEAGQRLIEAWLAAGVIERVPCTADHEEEGTDDCCEGYGWNYSHAAFSRQRAALEELVDALGGDGDDEPDAGLIGEAIDRAITALEGGEQHG